MILKLVAVAAVAAVIFGGVATRSTSAKGLPPPSAGTLLAGGFASARGMKIGPDGMIYVAEAGTGGTTVAPADKSKSGFTGRISKIDPATGAVTVVAANLPSNDTGMGVLGPADVAFVGSTLYYAQTHGGAAYGFPSNPTGVYRVNSNGTVTLIADTGTFNVANPVDDVKNKVQQDVDVGGNPYSMIARDSALFVVDGNQNQVMKVTTSGAITRMAEFHGHPITTGISYSGNGPFYVSALGHFPFAPADGRVFKVGYPSGTVTEVASGYSALTDVQASASGQLYALQIAEQALSQPFSGKVLRVNADGTLTPIVTGLQFPTFMAFSGDTLYVVNDGINSVGPSEVWSVSNFSAITPPAPTPTAGPELQAPPAPAPTATPRGGVIAGPNTGDGSSAGGAGGSTFVLAALALVAGVALCGGGIAVARTRR